MNKMVLTIGLVMVATIVMAATEADAQLLKPVYSGADADGMTMVNYDGRVRPWQTARMAKRNHFSPQRIYTYSNTGLEAGRTHTWNQEEAGCRPWHDNYMNWRWQEPTALVVPPTASYQTSYAWGVGTGSKHSNSPSVWSAGRRHDRWGQRCVPKNALLTFKYESVRNLPGTGTLVVQKIQAEVGLTTIAQDECMNLMTMHLAGLSN